jgi:cbb3-type cytochrome oxidase subunit 3
MFKDVLRHADLAQWAEAGLVVFFLVFLLAVAWAMTRRRNEVRQWAALPLDDGAAPTKEVHDE